MSFSARIHNFYAQPIHILVHTTCLYEYIQCAILHAYISSEPRASTYISPIYWCRLLGEGTTNTPNRILNRSTTAKKRSMWAGVRECDRRKKKSFYASLFKVSWRFVNAKTTSATTVHITHTHTHKCTL